MAADAVIIRFFGALEMHMRPAYLALGNHFGVKFVIVRFMAHKAVATRAAFVVCGGRLLPEILVTERMKRNATRIFFFSIVAHSVVVISNLQTKKAYVSVDD